MKKALSLILCVLMVIGSFSGAITVSAEGVNLWTDISVDDFGTKDTNACPISEFAEGKNNYGKNFVVKGAYYTSFYIEMPELDANTIYDLSFKYDNHIIESSKGKINSVSIVTEEEMAQITDVDGIKLPSTATTIGSALELDKGQYTDLSAAFTTGATKTKHYLYFTTAYAYWFYLCDFKLVKIAETVDPAKNVLYNTSAADWGAKSWSSVSKGTQSRYGRTPILVSSAMHQKIFTVVSLEANSVYDFAFNWKAILGTTHGSAVYPSEIYVYPISKVGDIMNAEKESGAAANSGKWDTNAVFHPLTGDLTDADNLLTVAVDRANNKEAALKAEWTHLATEFVTSDDTEYAILIHFNCNGATDNNKINLSDFELSKATVYNVAVSGGTADKTVVKEGATVTLTATPNEGQTFAGWEVLSNNVVLSNPNTITTSFTMPADSVSVKAKYISEHWANINSSYFGAVGTNANFKTSYAYGDNQSYYVDGVYYNKFYVKLPSNLEVGIPYNLSFYYNNHIISGKPASINQIYIATQEQLDAVSFANSQKIASSVKLDLGISVWPTIFAEFTPTENTQYYLVFDNAYVYRLKVGGFSLKENIKINRVNYVKPDGSAYEDYANLNPTTIETVENADGTCTDTLTYDTMDGVNSFLGWYKGDTLLGKELSYTYNPKEVNAVEITAKIVTQNVLNAAAGFESFANDQSLRVEPVATGVAPTNDRWGLIVGKNYETENIGFFIKATTAKQSTYYTDDGYDPETGTSAPEADRTVGKFDVTPHSGKSMLELSASYRSFVRKIEGLKPNTNYTFSMYVLTPDEHNFLSSVVISNGYSEEPSKLKTMTNRMVASSKEKIYGYYEEPRMEDFFETNTTIKDKSAVKNWKKISFNFTTDDTTSAYVYLTPRSKSTWYTRCQIFIDDMVIVENSMPNQGNAMRAAAADVPQALRYKFAINNALLTSYNGYTFKNMGILAADSSKISGYTLSKSTENVKDILVTEANYQYKEGDTENTYITAALYNIGRNGGKTDYAKYATDYIVRPYVVYENEAGIEYILYGENVSASIFEVMYAIRDLSTDENDINVVNGMLENEVVRKAYADWQPDDAWNIENPNPPAEYDYSFAVLGDLQYTTQYYPDKLPYTFDWLINNKDAKNLQYVINVGDLTNNSSQTEYEAISEQLLRLKEAGIDQSLVRGNHDKLADYDKYITAEKFMYGNGEFESYDGSMKTYYQKLNIGGIKYMVMVLDFFPSTAEVEWAKQKIDANPDYNVIINTHGYLDAKMQLLGEDAVYDVEDRVDAEGNAVGGHAGQYIYDNLVVPCSNVVMVICGHEFSEGPEIKTLTRADGSTAVQMLVDFQQAEYNDLRSYGMIAMLYFSNGGKTVTVEWFSSIKNEYYKDKYQYTMDINVIK